MRKPPSAPYVGREYTYHIEWAYYWLHDAAIRSVWRAKVNMEAALGFCPPTPEQQAELEHLRILIELASDLDTPSEPRV